MLMVRNSIRICRYVRAILSLANEVSKNQNVDAVNSKSAFTHALR